MSKNEPCVSDLICAIIKSLSDTFCSLLYAFSKNSGMYHFEEEEITNMHIDFPETINLRLFKCFHYHGNVIKWKHFPRYWPFVRESTRHRYFSLQRPVTRNFAVFFDLRLKKKKNAWVKKRDTGDFRRHHTLHDATVMILPLYFSVSIILCSIFVMCARAIY